MTSSLNSAATKGNRLRTLSTALTGAVLLTVAVGLTVFRSHAEEAHEIPAPAIDTPVESAASSEVAILAGGCFWGVQGVFQHVKGVTNAVSGYAGGTKATADYHKVSSGTTSHAEAVKVTYDPRQISYGRILQIYFSVAHDPTQLNRQGPDSGPQYRSAIFPTGPEQSRVATAYIAQLDKAHAYHSPIVTKIEQGQEFYPAEDYHQDFMTRNPTHPYIVYNDQPKIEDLQHIFADRYRKEPVLVAAARPSH